MTDGEFSRRVSDTVEALCHKIELPLALKAKTMDEMVREVVLERVVA